MKAVMFLLKVAHTDAKHKIKFPKILSCGSQSQK